MNDHKTTDIGQAYFAEIITVDAVEEVAVPGSQPEVGVALNNVAFNKKYRRLPPKPESPPRFTAATLATQNVSKLSVRDNALYMRDQNSALRSIVENADWDAVIQTLQCSESITTITASLPIDNNKIGQYVRRIMSSDLANHPINLKPWEWRINGTFVTYDDLYLSSLNSYDRNYKWGKWGFGFVESGGFIRQKLTVLPGVEYLISIEVANTSVPTKTPTVYFGIDGIVSDYRTLLPTTVLTPIESNVITYETFILTFTATSASCRVFIESDGPIAINEITVCVKPTNVISCGTVNSNVDNINYLLNSNFENGVSKWYGAQLNFDKPPTIIRELPATGVGVWDSVTEELLLRYAYPPLFNVNGGIAYPDGNVTCVMQVASGLRNDKTYFLSILVSEIGGNNPEAALIVEAYDAAGRRLIASGDGSYAFDRSGYVIDRKQVGKIVTIPLNTILDQSGNVLSASIQGGSAQIVLRCNSASTLIRIKAALLCANAAVSGGGAAQTGGGNVDPTTLSVCDTYKTVDYAPLFNTTLKTYKKDSWDYNSTASLISPDQYTPHFTLYDGDKLTKVFDGLPPNKKFRISLRVMDYGSVTVTFDSNGTLTTYTQFYSPKPYVDRITGITNQYDFTYGDINTPNQLTDVKWPSALLLNNNGAVTSPLGYTYGKIMEFVTTVPVSGRVKVSITALAHFRGPYVAPTASNLAPYPNKIINGFFENGFNNWLTNSKVSIVDTKNFSVNLPIKAVKFEEGGSLIAQNVPLNVGKYYYIRFNIRTLGKYGSFTIPGFRSIDGLAVRDGTTRSGFPNVKLGIQVFGNRSAAYPDYLPLYKADSGDGVVAGALVDGFYISSIGPIATAGFANISFTAISGSFLLSQVSYIPVDADPSEVNGLPLRINSLSSCVSVTAPTDATGGGVEGECGAGKIISFSDFLEASSSINPFYYAALPTVGKLNGYAELKLDAPSVGYSILQKTFFVEPQSTITISYDLLAGNGVFVEFAGDSGKATRDKSAITVGRCSNSFNVGSTGKCTIGITAVDADVIITNITVCTNVGKQTVPFNQPVRPSIKPKLYWDFEDSPRYENGFPSWLFDKYQNALINFAAGVGGGSIGCNTAATECSYNIYEYTTNSSNPPAGVPRQTNLIGTNVTRQDSSVNNRWNASNLGKSLVIEYKKQNGSNNDQYANLLNAYATEFDINNYTVSFWTDYNGNGSFIFKIFNIRMHFNEDSFKIYWKPHQKPAAFTTYADEGAAGDAVLYEQLNDDDHIGRKPSFWAVSVERARTDITAYVYYNVSVYRNNEIVRENVLLYNQGYPWVGLSVFAKTVPPSVVADPGVLALDDIRAYDVVLTHDNIRGIYNNGAGSNDDPPELINGSQKTLYPTITKLNALYQWAGSPRLPVNIFSTFVRYTVRSLRDPTVKTIYNALPVAEGHNAIQLTPQLTSNSYKAGLNVCVSTKMSARDFWKQNSNGGILEPIVSLPRNDIKSVNSGDRADVRQSKNWLWSIPTCTDSANQDKLNIEYAPIAYTDVVESVEIYTLHQKVASNSLQSDPELPIVSIKSIAVPTLPFLGGEVATWEVVGNVIRSIKPGVPDYHCLRVGVQSSVNSTKTVRYEITCRLISGVPSGAVAYMICTYRYPVDSMSFNSGPNIQSRYSYLNTDGSPQGWIYNANCGNDNALAVLTVPSDQTISFAVEIDVCDIDSALGELNLTATTSAFEASKTQANWLPLIIEISNIAIKRNVDFNTVAANLVNGNLVDCNPTADRVNITLAYDKSDGKHKEFTSEFKMIDMFESSDDICHWDVPVAVGYGVKGTTASWSVIKYNLDTLSGDGLDQMTEPQIFIFTGKTPGA